MSIKYDKYVKRPLEEHEYTPEQIKELSKCTNNINPFLKYVKIIHPDKGRVIFEPYKFQKNILKTIKKERFTCILCSRQSGKTTVVSVYALWYAIFTGDKNIGIVSNKEKSAISILHRIKAIYKELPNWLKPGVEQYNKMSVHFDNGSKIFVSTTSEDAFRGEPLNLLICDELGFVRKGIADDFWAANYPTVSASKVAKIVVISTPNGMFNLFHRIFTEGEKKINKFKSLKYTWEAVPGRNKKWAKEQLANIGKTRFAQEFSCVSEGTMITVQNTETNEIFDIDIKDFYDSL